MYNLIVLLEIVSFVCARTINSDNEELRVCKKNKLELETEVASLKHTISMNILEKQLQAVQNDVIFLIDKSRAEGKKMLALYDEIREIKTKMEATEHKINTMVVEKVSLMDNQQKAIVMNISSPEIRQDLRLEQVKHTLKAVTNNVSYFGDKLDVLETELTRKTENLLNIQNKMCDETNIKLELLEREHNATIKDVQLLTERYNKTDVKMSLMANEQKTTKLDIASLERQHLSVTRQTDNLLGNQTEIRKQISGVLNTIMDSQEYRLTAFGTSNGIKSSGTTLLFPDIKLSFGISNLSTFTSTGKFTCEKAGLYLVSVTVMSCTKDTSKYSVYKNNVELAPYYIGYFNNVFSCNSASGTILIQLNVNDNVYVKTASSNMEVYDKWSSFTVTKLK